MSERTSENVFTLVNALITTSEQKLNQVLDNTYGQRPCLQILKIIRDLDAAIVDVLPLELQNNVRDSMRDRLRSAKQALGLVPGQSDIKSDAPELTFSYRTYTEDTFVPVVAGIIRPEANFVQQEREAIQRSTDIDVDFFEIDFTDFIQQARGCIRRLAREADKEHGNILNIIAEFVHRMHTDFPAKEYVELIREISSELYIACGHLEKICTYVQPGPLGEFDEETSPTSI